MALSSYELVVQKHHSTAQEKETYTCYDLSAALDYYARFNSEYNPATIELWRIDNDAPDVRERIKYDNHPPRTCSAVTCNIV